MYNKVLGIGHIDFMCRPAHIRGEKTYAIIRKRDIESTFCRVLAYNKDKNVLKSTAYEDKGQVWLIHTSCNANGTPNLKYVYHDEQLNVDREKYRELQEKVDAFIAEAKARYTE